MKPTLSIGIAAYNEAKNIGALISAFLAQKISSVQLMEIIVVSDASTDKTDEIVRSFLDKTVRLIRLEKRSGVSLVQNKIMEIAQGDILVVSDADILPSNEYHIENLIAPILADDRVALTSAVLITASPKTFIERILVQNHKFKTKLFEAIDGGDNIYNCAGPSRAFSKKFYKKLQYPDNYPNDAYSFLYRVKNGFKFKYAPKARAIFRCPAILADHAKQSVRYITGKRAIIELFGDDAKTAYKIPKRILIKMLFIEFISHPLLLSCYIFMTIFTNIKAKNSKFISKWDTIATSKKI